jgi:serine/threonine protein kinase
MGEVYRARDSRLQRDVALKVLPDVAAADPDRRERFTREALAVAALNHPHIVTIHSVEHAGPTVFLTMELVEGRSLAEALRAGGLPLDRVLTIGIAVAEAMSAAHQKGITHRDLKPGNIMLGDGEQAGRVKVLDFGLAKVVDAPLSGGGSLVPTEAVGQAPFTAEGQILGTVSYMSPEQAEGRAIDGRSDLFSLGVVLYEMATGQRPFSGDTNLSILSSILRDAPRSVTDINPALPPDFGRIIRRALAKNPERRYQSAKDLRNDLEDLKAALDSGEHAAQPASRPVASSAPLVPSAPPAALAPSSDAQLAAGLVRKHSGVLLAALVVLVVGTVAVVAWLRRGPQPASSEQPGTRSSLGDLQITQLTTSGNAERPAISPDGRYVAYVQSDGADFSLWIRQTTSTSNVQIVAPAPGVTLFGATFTPDATSVDFVRQAPGALAEIWRVPFLGGTPRPIITDVASAVAWAPDGQRIAFLRSRLTPTLTTQLIVAAPDGGQQRALIGSAPGTPIVSLVAPWRPNIPPAWSPDGRLIAVSAASPAGAHVLFVDSGTGETREVAAPIAVTGGLAWLDPHSLVFNGPVHLGELSQLFRLEYPSGSVTRLTNDPNDYVGISLSGDRGTLVTGRRDPRMDVWVGDGGAGAGRDVVQRVPISVERLVWSGDRLLYAAFVGGRPAILRLAPGEGTPEEVVSEAFTPGVTSDGRTIAFVSSTDNLLSLWTADASGRRIAQLVPSVTASFVVVTPDDRSVIYSSIFGGTVSIWIVPIDGGTPTKLADGGSVAVSPDGASMAFTAQSADQRPSIVVCSLPGCGSPRPIGSAAFDGALAWTPDGRGVAYASDGNVWVTPLGGGAPRQLTRFTDRRSISSIAWSRDGKRLAVTRSTATNDIVLFRGVK